MHWKVMRFSAKFDNSELRTGGFAFFCTPNKQSRNKIKNKNRARIN